VNEGAVEWPPSPWRLLRALFATWQARASHLDASVVSALLEQLATLPTYRLPVSLEGHTRHYLPDGHRDAQQIQGREGTDKALDAFAVLEADAELLVTWPVDLDSAHRRALAELTSLLPYVGRAESLCDARLLDDLPTPARDGEQTIAPRVSHDGEASTRLLAPRTPLSLASLAVQTADLRRARFLEPPGAFWAEYDLVREILPSPPSPVGRSPKRPTVVRWALDGAALPSAYATVAVAERLRHAAQSRYGELHAKLSSEQLSGKDTIGVPLKGHQHAHYLPVDSDGDGLLDEAYLWCPAGLDASEIAACARINRLMPGTPQAGFQPVRVVLLSVGDVDSVAAHLAGPASVWTSATPFAPPRHSKLDWMQHLRLQVDEELHRRGQPATLDVEGLSRRPWLAFRRHRVTERLADGRRATGLRLTFGQRVHGPLALGALSHFGLGLFLPDD
jgi:CRISPR-associated protein Csb2